MNTTQSSVAVGAQSVPLDVSKIRQDFPILSRTMNGKPFVYLDNGATSLKPQTVIDAEVRYYTELGANIHRGVYEFSEKASALYDQARSKVAGFIGARDARQVVFTKSATESVNLIAYGWALKNIKPGDEICVSEIEHHANFVPWQMLAERCGATLRFIPLLPAEGTLDLSELGQLINERTRVVAITAMSNVTGYMPPVEVILTRARAVGAITVVDGAQLVSHSAVDVESLDADFLVFSAHKMCGPTGVGFLCAAPERLEEIEPVYGGGEMIARVEETGATWADIPHRFEAGTPNIAGVIGMGAAFRYLADLGMETVRQREEVLTRAALERLRAVPGLQIVGAARDRAGVIAFALDGAHPHDVAQLLDRDGIAIRAGHMCAQPLLRRFGHAALNRVSLSFYNREDELDVLAASLARIRSALGHGS